MLAVFDPANDMGDRVAWRHINTDMTGWAVEERLEFLTRGVYEGIEELGRTVV